MADDRDSGTQRDREEQIEPRRKEKDEQAQRGYGREGERDTGTRDSGVERSDGSDESEMERGGKRASEDLDADDR